MIDYIMTFDKPMDGTQTSVAENVKELVRCRDCDNWHQMECPFGVLHWDAPPADGYCFKGVKAHFKSPTGA